MGKRSLLVCQQIQEKTIEMFINNVPKSKSGRALHISPSTVNNIKPFKELEGSLEEFQCIKGTTQS